MRSASQQPSAVDNGEIDDIGAMDGGTVVIKPNLWNPLHQNLYNIIKVFLNLPVYRHLLLKTQAISLQHPQDFSRRPSWKTSLKPGTPTYKLRISTATLSHSEPKNLRPQLFRMTRATVVKRKARIRRRHWVPRLCPPYARRVTDDRGRKLGGHGDAKPKTQTMAQRNPSTYSRSVSMYNVFVVAVLAVLLGFLAKPGSMFVSRAPVRRGLCSRKPSTLDYTRKPMKRTYSARVCLILMTSSPAAMTYVCLGKGMTARTGLMLMKRFALLPSCAQALGDAARVAGLKGNLGKFDADVCLSDLPWFSLCCLFHLT